MVASAIVTVDVVGSTSLKFRYDQRTAAQRINNALNRVRDALCEADESLRCPTAFAGDSILLVGGVNPVEIYRAAVVFQAKFRAWEYGRLPVKITIGFGIFESIKGDHDVEAAHHGSDLDELYAVAAWCPPAGVVVTQAMYSVLEHENQKYVRRFHERVERLKGFGQRVFYQSNGDYRPPKLKRPWSVLPQTRSEFTTALSIGASGLIAAVVLYAYLYGGVH